MNYQSHITEIWFSGVHSDVGGGYRIDGLSDITLKFMIDKAKDLGLNFLNLKDIDNKVLNGKDHEGDSVIIGRDDIKIAPDNMSKIHYHNQKWRTGFLKEHTLAPRLIDVMINNLPSNHLPLIHHTVESRMKKDKSYKPLSLIDENYQVI